MLCNALVCSHLTYILRPSTTTSNLVRIFSHTCFCQETKTIKPTVIFTTSCLVNSILKRTGIHYKSCVQSAISINLAFYHADRTNASNHISWSQPAGQDGAAHLPRAQLLTASSTTARLHQTVLSSPRACPAQTTSQADGQEAPDRHLKTITHHPSCKAMRFSRPASLLLSKQI